ncbi:MAG TPA: MBL fold metallo-hydrolase [Thermodesulfobacteriota bacterium]|nr:MBL fold metallo-hydrolase [Thermodesulfobacteriota bacterium]
MKIKLLNHNDRVYSSNAYLVMGTWRKLEDVNTLIDVGNDPSILVELEKSYTGVGKKKVDQVILTHNHFDHTGNLNEIKKRYGAMVYAFNGDPLVDERLKDGRMLHVGDQDFEVIHTPGHSSDSICLYCRQAEVLFSGDTPLKIMTVGGGYSQEYIEALTRISSKQIRTIYPGHDQPMTHKLKEMLQLTLENVKTSTVYFERARSA